MIKLTFNIEVEGMNNVQQFDNKAHFDNWILENAEKLNCIKPIGSFKNKALYEAYILENNNSIIFDTLNNTCNFGIIEIIN